MKSEVSHYHVHNAHLIQHALPRLGCLFSLTFEALSRYSIAGVDDSKEISGESECNMFTSILPTVLVGNNIEESFWPFIVIVNFAPTRTDIQYQYRPRIKHLREIMIISTQEN